MIQLTFQWHLLIPIVLLAIGLRWVFLAGDYETMFGSPRDWRWLVFVFYFLFVMIVYGGIFWW